jgi:NitT/TauT family transport system ATP-binding protein
MGAPRLELCGVAQSYITRQGETAALADISFAVAPGEFVSVVGPSGCGKSTILSLLAGLLPPTAGHVLVDGKPVTGPSRRTGYMLQRDYLFAWRTILDNCLLGPEIQGLDMGAARQRVLALLEQTGLAPFAHAYPDQLSGGMRQRAALVRTLAIDPDLLLLDEPFSALDFQTRLRLQDEVWTLLKSAGKTAVLVTHDIGEAVAMGDRVLVLTPRPARVQSEHAITFADPRPAPLHVREEPAYRTYFRRIWEELSHGEQPP